MKKTVLFLVFTILININIKSQIPSWDWAQNINGSLLDVAASIDVDASGNSYVTGFFESPTLIVGSTVLTNASSSYDIFVTKLDPLGNVIWAKRYGGVGDDRGYSIAFDNIGNAFITGAFLSPIIIFGSTTLTNSSVAGTSQDVFIAKLNPSGDPIWAKSAIGAVNFVEFGNSIAVGADGCSYITGDNISPTLNFGGIILTGQGPFVVKYDPLGNAIWAKKGVSAYQNSGRSIAVDLSNNVYVTGNFQSPTIGFGSITLTNTSSPSTTISDIFIVKYDSIGNVLWAKSAGGDTYDDIGYGISLDDLGNSYTIGKFQSPTINFGSIILNNANPGLADIFIVKHNSAGVAIWAKSAGGTLKDECFGVKSDSIGNTYITGYSASSTISFGTTILSNTTIGSCSGVECRDMFVAKYDTLGNPLWAKSVSGSSGENGNSISVDQIGNSYIAGQFYSPSIAFGSTLLTNLSTGPLKYDSFVAKLGSGLTTGNSNIQTAEEIKIFPNPVNNLLVIEVLTNSIGSEYNIFDQLGRLISFGKLTSEITSINLSELSKGVYFVKIGKLNKKPFKVIKQ